MSIVVIGKICCFFLYKIYKMRVYGKGIVVGCSIDSQKVTKTLHIVRSYQIEII